MSLQHLKSEKVSLKKYLDCNLLVGCQFMEGKFVIFADHLVVGEGRPYMRDKMYRIHVWSKKEV
jgi:hypothetical protein